jgi:hypothetical protein
MSEAKVSRTVLEIISKTSGTVAVSQLVVEVLGKAHISSSYVSQQVVEVLGKAHISTAYVSQNILEVLAHSELRWRHNILGVPNANISTLNQIARTALVSVMGVT